MTEEKELDIVEELRFFAEATETKEIKVVMLSGRTFTDAADEIERLRDLIVKWVDLADDPSVDSKAYVRSENALREAVGKPLLFQP